ncbi:MAG TPA: flippase [Daejeonella sp.]|nr:flippase [Daejeonella sp.]
MTRNYFYNLLLTLTNILFPILSFPYASRVLGPIGIGKVQFILSFAQYFALFAALGIPVYGIKEIANRGHKKNRSLVFSELITIHLITSLLLAVLYLLIIYFIPFFHAERGIYLGAVCIVLFGFSTIDWLYSGLAEFKSIALRSVTIKVISILLLFFLVRDRNDYDIYLYIMIFSLLGNNLLSFILLPRSVKILFKGLNLLKHVKPLLFIFATTLASSMYTVMDTLLLGFLANEKAVGLYTAAVRLTKVTLPFITSMGVVLVPVISKEFSKNNFSAVQTHLDKSFRYIAFFAIPAVIGLVLLAPELITIFSGPEFRNATISMQILALLPLIIGFGHFFLILILVPAGKNKEMLISVCGGVITSLGLNFLLVPSFQEMGSSIANVCSEVVVTGLYIYHVKKYFSFNYDWNLLLKALVCSLLFIPIIGVMRSWNINMLVFLFLSGLSCVLAYLSIQRYLFKSHFLIEVIDFVRLKLKRGDNGGE